MKDHSKEHIAVERPHQFIDNATQRIYRFPNNYGASVVWGGDTVSVFGDLSKPYELAVIRFVDEDDHYYLDYSTTLGTDVYTYQNDEQIRDLLKQIKELERVDHGI
jgi:hypothetical protein